MPRIATIFILVIRRSRTPTPVAGRRLRSDAGGRARPADGHAGLTNVGAKIYRELVDVLDEGSRRLRDIGLEPDVDSRVRRLVLDVHVEASGVSELELGVDATAKRVMIRDFARDRADAFSNFAAKVRPRVDHLPFRRNFDERSRRAVGSCRHPGGRRLVARVFVGARVDVFDETEVDRRMRWMRGGER